METTMAQRYGKPSTPKSRRGVLLALFAGFLVAAAAFIWFGVRQHSDQVQWIDLGSEVVSDEEVSMTFQVQMPPGAVAVCALQAVNTRNSEVGRADVRVGPSTTDAVKVSAAISTSELADGARVRLCKRLQ